ncbi:MAG: helix-turn-helix transcriptional regulator [Ruminiclostridium sp.]|nr:helix-turn-helix transcriptional regulator [Ruminiclostridium sp.]
MNEKFAERLSQLRSNIGVSAREISLSIGQSPGYINNIENKKNLPSMTAFFDICDYFKISPMEFFDYETENPKLSRELITELRKLDYRETGHILEIVKDINRKK